MLTAADIIEFGLMTGPSNETAGEGADRIAGALDKAGLLAPDPQVIRTVEELEALDPDTLLQPPLNAFSEWPQILTAAGLLDTIRTWEGPWLPAVKVAEGAHLRACREALEGETT